MARPECPPAGSESSRIPPGAKLIQVDVAADGGETASRMKMVANVHTFVRHGLPIVTVVNNDQQWGMSAHGQDLLFGKDRRVVTNLAPTRYDLAAAEARRRCPR